MLLLFAVLLTAAHADQLCLNNITATLDIVQLSATQALAATKSCQYEHPQCVPHIQQCSGTYGQSMTQVSIAIIACSADPNEGVCVPALFSILDRGSAIFTNLVNAYHECQSNATKALCNADIANATLLIRNAADSISAALLVCNSSLYSLHR